MIRISTPVYIRLSSWNHSGGEGGIRTLGTGVSPYNGLANRRIRPLCHLSGLFCRENDAKSRYHLRYYTTHIVRGQRNEARS